MSSTHKKESESKQMEMTLPKIRFKNRKNSLATYSLEEGITLKAVPSTASFIEPAKKAVP